MSLSAVMERLESIPELAGRVGIAATHEEVVTQTKTFPFAWLTGIEGQSNENQFMTAVRQIRRLKFTVVVAARDVTDASGAKALDAVESLRQSIHSALLGFEMSAEYTPIEYESDALVAYGDSALFWGDRFMTTHIIGS